MDLGSGCSTDPLASMILAKCWYLSDQDADMRDATFDSAKATDDLVWLYAVWSVGSHTLSHQVKREREIDDARRDFRQDIDLEATARAYRVHLEAGRCCST